MPTTQATNLVLRNQLGPLRSATHKAMIDNGHRSLPPRKTLAAVPVYIFDRPVYLIGIYLNLFLLQLPDIVALNAKLAAAKDTKRKEDLVETARAAQQKLLDATITAAVKGSASASGSGGPTVEEGAA
ncbi:hypothetical protein Rhopal_007581-T1 [Rhodotorula paludigena]|uniref:Uncharacterized protein n=1 Tax=Rhodotorula paludigena TaxID=86838 RepID=A0AAV5GX14_9BASI|nr:hypothetical protein Rhopal_007581-T1 [Rhodotorula paludigena]